MIVIFTILISINSYPDVLSYLGEKVDYTQTTSEESYESSYDEDGIPYGEVQSIETLYICGLCGVDIYIESDDVPIESDEEEE